MLFVVMNILFLAPLAMAATVQPSVQLSSDSDAVHLLVGDAGEQISACGLASDGWGCEPIDVEGPQPMAVLLNTNMIRLGTIEAASDSMTVHVRDGVAEVAWDEASISTVEPSHEVFVVRLTGASADPAPMVNIAFGGQTSEARCGDDGRFPDAGINDGVFTCSLVTAVSTTKEKVASFQLRLGPIEEQPLGSVQYSGPSGLRFAQLTVGEPGAAKEEPFVLPVGVRGAEQGGDKPEVLSPKDIAIEAGEYIEAPAEVSSVDQTPAELMQKRSSAKPTSGWVGTALALCLVVVGVLMGRYSRRGVSSKLQGSEAIDLGALDGNGPVPNKGAILVHADPPGHALLHLAQTLTPYRRLVLVGTEKPQGLQPALDVVWVTDRDWRSIPKLAKQ